MKHVQPWLRAIVTDMSTQGIPGLTSSLNNIASQFSVAYQEGEEGGEEKATEGEELIEVQAPTTEKPAEEEAAPEKAEETTEEELTAILEGKEPTPAEATKETPEAAAGTFGEFKRRLRKVRKQRRVEAASETPEELLKTAAVLFKTLEA
jgi:hypothetical protein